MTAIRRALTIAGSDPGGGAGIQQDLKVFTSFGIWGLSAVTAVTVQDTSGVRSSHPVSWETVVAQIDAVAADIGVDAAKTGMLPDAACVRAVAGTVARHGFPLVVDPILAAGDGTPLMDADAIDAVRDRLLPRATLVTPNAHEAAVLTGLPVTTIDEQDKAAQALCDMGATAALVTGGHLPGDATDVFFDGTTTLILSLPRIGGGRVHGTGCVLSAAVAAGLAAGADLISAVRTAKEFVDAAIGSALTIGGGARVANADPRFRPAGSHHEG